MQSSAATAETTRPTRAGDGGVRVLIVDDHIELISNVFAYLEDRQFILDAARDGESALSLCRDSHYDVVVLDWMLPKISGLQVLQRLRADGLDVPVLMLTARGELPDKLAGFSAGADDYLTKPFLIAELEARILALHARRAGRAQTLQVGPLRYDAASHQVTRDGEVIVLHTGPRKLLRLLMQESPKVVGKDRLEDLLWGEDRPQNDLLRTHIYELRRAIDGGHAQKLLQTIARVGYRLAVPDDQQ